VIDIVERLRLGPLRIEIEHEAADEIERLRAKNVKISMRCAMLIGEMIKRERGITDEEIAEIEAPTQ
jgi:hypothetical protein